MKEIMQDKLKRVLLTSLTLMVLNSSVIAERLLDPMPQTMEAKNFSLPNVEGELVSLDDYRGSFVLVNFWSKDCLVCQAELNVLQDLASQLQKNYKFQILGIHAGPDTEAVNAVLSKNPIEFTTVMDAELTLGHWGIPQLPTSYLISPEGNFSYRAVGTRIWNAPNMVDLLRSVMDTHDADQASENLFPKSRTKRIVGNL